MTTNFICKIADCKNLEELKEALEEIPQFVFKDGKVVEWDSQKEMTAMFENGDCFLNYK
jgi:hypothetical protein